MNPSVSIGPTICRTICLFQDCRDSHAKIQRAGALDMSNRVFKAVEQIFRQRAVNHMPLCAVPEEWPHPHFVGAVK
jgi:hypothetical protein